MNEIIIMLIMLLGGAVLGCVAILAYKIPFIRKKIDAFVDKLMEL